MSEKSRETVTEILVQIDRGPNGSAEPERLAPLVYEELRRMADRRLGRERADHTLQATELVHEAYLKLVDQSRIQWAGRSHFMAVAATAMRRILLDHARHRSRVKRGGDQKRVTLHEELQSPLGGELAPEDLIVLDAALVELERQDPRQAKVVELRSYGGLTVAEVAESLGVSKRTVEGEWAHALAWMRRRLADEGPY